MREGPLTYHYVDNSARGLPIRHLLAHANADFTTKNYDWATSHKDLEDKSNYLFPKWFQDKQKLCVKNPFVLLPYLETEDGEIVSSTVGIMRYLGEGFNYATGEDGKVNVKDHIVRNALDQAHSLREGFFKAMLNGKQAIENYADPNGFGGPWSILKAFEMQLEQILTSSGKTGTKTYLFSPIKVSIVDLYLTANISALLRWHTKILTNFPNLKIWYDFMLENENLAREIELEKKEPFFGHQDGFDLFEQQMNLVGKSGYAAIVWGVPGKMDPMY